MHGFGIFFVIPTIWLLIKTWLEHQEEIEAERRRNLLEGFRETNFNSSDDLSEKGGHGGN